MSCKFFRNLFSVYSLQGIRTLEDRYLNRFWQVVFQFFSILEVLIVNIYGTLTENHTKYSVFISGKSLRDRKSRFIINKTLVGVSKEEQEAMREQVIRLIPRIVYADNTIRLETGFEDAFDLAVKGILDKIETSRRVIKEKEKAMDSIC